MERADEGDVVVVQRDNEPHGVYLSYRHYESMVEKLNRLESLELALIALPRKEAVDQGEMGTTSLADMIAEFAPDLAAKPAGA